MYETPVEGRLPLTAYGPRDGGNFEYAWEGSFLAAHLLSDVGKKRKKNEDSCILCVPEHDALVKERGMLFGVADGMGGATAGEFASRMALRYITDEYFRGPLDDIPVALRAAVEVANLKVFEEAEVNPLLSGMGTTASIITVLGEWAYVAQVGDSRVYLLREHSGIHQVTNDHSLVAEQVRCGLLTEDEARHHSLKNLITRAVGIKDTVKVDLFAFRLRRGDTVLLCSDGLSNMVTDIEIAEALSIGELRLATRRVVERALDAGGSDNVTAVSVRVTGSPPHAELRPGAEEVDLPRPNLVSRLRQLFT